MSDQVEATTVHRTVGRAGASSILKHRSVRQHDEPDAPPNRSHLVDCRIDFFSMDSVLNIAVVPGKRFGGSRVSVDVAHQLASSRSFTEVKIPRAITSRSMRENQSST